MSKLVYTKYLENVTIFSWRKNLVIKTSEQYVNMRVVRCHKILWEF